jgi:hypothetical protein
LPIQRATAEPAGGPDALCQALRKNLDIRLALAAERAAKTLQEGHDATREAASTFARAKQQVADAVFATGAAQDIVAAPGRRTEAILLAALKKQHLTAMQAYLAAVEPPLLAELSRALAGLPTESDTSTQALTQAMDAQWLERTGMHRLNINAAGDTLLACASRADVGAVANALLHLAGNMDAWNMLSKSASSHIPASVQGAIGAQVQEYIAASMVLLRHPENPDGLLDAKTLGALADLEFGLVCRASGKLRVYGLDLSPSAVQQQMLARTAQEKNYAIEKIADFGRLLANPYLTPQQAAYGTRQMADANRAIHRLLERLGKPVQGADAFGDFVLEHVQAGLAGLPVGAGMNPVVRKNLDTIVQPILLALLEAKLQVASDEIEARVADVANPAAEVVNLITASVYLVSALSARLQGLDGNCSPAPAVSPPELTTALAQAFPFKYLPSGEARSRINLPVAKVLHDAVAFLPDIQSRASEWVTVLGREGESRSLLVDKQFHNDAIVRASVSFAVRGMCGAGTHIRHLAFTPELAGTERKQAMNDALWALRDMVGDDAQRLTAVMNQQLTGGLMAALGALGAGSPLELADGRIFQPAGAGALHFEIVRRPDASFLINTSIHMNELSSVTCFSYTTSADSPELTGMPVPVSLNEANSRFSCTFSLLLAADGASMEVVEAVDFRYCLDEADVVVIRL